jgi:hypothetical protein
MWAIFAVIGYFLLALLIPIAWSLGNVWRRTRDVQAVTCPGDGEPALLSLDPGHAIRMHLRGDAELRVLECSQWPELGGCARQCLTQIAVTH